MFLPKPYLANHFEFLKRISDTPRASVCRSRLDGAQQGCNDVLGRDLYQQDDPTLSTSILGRGGGRIDRNSDLHFGRHNFKVNGDRTRFHLLRWDLVGMRSPVFLGASSPHSEYPERRVGCGWATISPVYVDISAPGRPEEIVDRDLLCLACLWVVNRFSFPRTVGLHLGQNQGVTRQ